MICNSSPVKAPRVLVDRAQSVVVEQLLAPDVRADQREIAPVDADIAGELLLQRPQRALARGRRPFGIHDHGSLLARAANDSLRAQRPRTTRARSVCRSASLPYSLQAMSAASDATSSRPPQTLPWRTSSADTMSPAPGTRSGAARHPRRALSPPRRDRTRLGIGAGRDDRGAMPSASRKRAQSLRGRRRSALGAPALERTSPSSASISARNRCAVLVRGFDLALRGSTQRARIARVMRRKLMPRSSIFEPSGTERSAVTRIRSSCSARRAGRNVTRRSFRGR